MVYISRLAKIDLDNILIGLLTWDKIALSVAETEKYIDEIVDSCYELDKKQRHQNCIFEIHRHAGEKFIRYRRNKHTIWYIVYNISSNGDIFVERIFNNYQTSH